jgi:hypothetical protein
VIAGLPHQSASIMGSNPVIPTTVHPCQSTIPIVAPELITLA